MNTTRILQAVKDIEANTAALKWLEEYGVQLNGRSRDQIYVSISMSFAGSCNGAKEAAEVLEAFVRLDIEALVQTSIRNCRNTIDMARAAIIEEAGKVTP